MHIETYLKKHQPIIYQTFCNALKEKKLSHAYLLSGDIGTPLLEIAKYLSKSILCEDPSPLACDSCINCLRVDSGHYADLFVFDGSEKLINDDNVSSIQEKLETYAIEKKGIRIYILHLVENMTLKAINSLLKTLEEPTTETYAFLTTTNENRILQTIISRCQVLKLKPIERKIIIEEAIEEGVSREDAELISYFYNDADLIVNYVNNQEKYADFNKTKLIFNQTLEALNEGTKEDIVFYFINEVSPQIKSRPQLTMLIDFLIQLYEELFSIRKNHELFLLNYAKILNEINERYVSIDAILEELLKLKSNNSSNIALTIDHIAITLIKDIYDKQ